MDPVALLLNWWQQPHRSIGLDLLAFSLLLLSSLLYLQKLTRPCKLNLPPSPPKLPKIGNLHQLGSLLHRSLLALSQQYGPKVLLHVGNAPLLVVSSSAIAKEVLNGRDAVFSQRPQIRAVKVLFYGCSDLAFSPYGEYWRKVKQICVTEVLSQRRVEQFRFVREEEVVEMVGDILLNLQRNGMLDINLTQENLKAIILNMFVGGVDTVATTMEWAMAELVKNPGVMKKAQEEVRRVVGERSKVDEADILQMNYLKCVVKETLRLHTPVIIRGSSASAKLEGYDIPSGTKNLINAWAIQRDPKLWDRPEEFLPERFANNRIDFKGQHEQFIPFGMGRRGCPGISFAMIEVEYVMANLLHWFDWDLPLGATPDKLDMSDVFKLGVRKKVPLLLIPVLHSP